MLFAIISCKKDRPIYDGNCTGNCFVLQGKVVEQQTQTPLGNIKIGIYFKHPSGGLGSSTDHLGEITTKLDGSYFFSFPKSAYSQGLIKFQGGIQGYINDNFQEGINTIASVRTDYIQQDTITTELKLWKSAFLKIHVATSTITNFNSFFFNNTFQGSYFGVYSVPGNRSFDTTFNILTASDIPTYITWSTTQGTILRGKDTVIVPSGTVGNLLIQL